MKNRLFKKRLLLFIFSFLCLLIFPFFLTPPKARAETCLANQCNLWLKLNNYGNRINWQVKANANDGNGFMGFQTTTVSGGSYQTIKIDQFSYADTIPLSVTYKWAQSCVDPSTTGSVSAGNFSTNTAYGVEDYFVDINISCQVPALNSCSVNLGLSGTTGYAATGHTPSDYAACPGLNDTSRTVNLCNVCPSSSACAVNGTDIGTGTCAANCASGYTCGSSGGNWGSCGPVCSPQAGPPPTPTPGNSPPCDSCSGAYGACSTAATCGPGTQTCTLDTFVDPDVNPCTIKQSNGHYLQGGACNSDKTMLYTCGGTPNNGTGTAIATELCNCQVNNGTYDSCPGGALTCTQGQSAPIACSGPTCNTNPIGNHDEADCSAIAGWTCDPDKTSQSLNVSIYDGNRDSGGTLLGNVTANGNRPDVPAAGYCGGNAAVGFNFSTPASIQDNGTHSIYVYPNNIDASGNAAGANPLLGGSPKSLGPCSYSATAHVYVDYNGNGVQNKVGDPGYTGTIDEPDYAPENGYTASNDITYGGATGANTQATTGAGGNYIVTNVPAGGTETISVNVPATWKPTTSQTSSVTSAAVVNFGIQPPAPTCTITASPTTVNPGGNSTLSVTATKPSGYSGALTYNWYTDLGSVSPATTTDPTTTTNWTAPSPYWDQNTKAIPSVQTCLPGGTLDVCGNCGVDINHEITINPLHSISGFVYTDLNKNTKYDSSTESYYKDKSLPVSICPSSGNPIQVTTFCPSLGGSAINTSNGAFDTGANPALPPGEYTVSLTSLPDSSYSYSGNSYAVTVGKPCPAAGEPSGVCDGPTGNVSNVALGIDNSNVWIQSTGGDIYQVGGVSNLEPANVPAACGGPTGHMSISQNPAIQMPGIVFTGNGSADFGAGDANLNNWVVGISPYINSISLPQTTAYATVKNSLQSQGVTPIVDLATKCSINGCTLPNNLPAGVYSVSGDLKLTGAGTNNGKANTFPGSGNFTFLISGGLDIATEIHVPVGTTATFIVGGDITVDASVGSAYDSSVSNIDGYYSTDGNFIVQGTNSCPAKDQRLNMSGAVVVNANGSGGSFKIKRDMCENDVCPTFSITARPDFVLNTPSYLLSPTRIWKELAP